MTTRTGPQYYPGASQSHWYEDDYPGDAQEVNVLVLHTTEGRALPTYGGGSSAPNLTALPDFENRRLIWHQHFRFDTSSRALKNLAGGVETNTLNVGQVELVGTCDPDTRAAWLKKGLVQDRDFVFWPDAPEWARKGLAAFLAWAHDQHGVPLDGPALWPAYPKSYANGGGQRMSGARWNDFQGVCGHMHVPENDHGDPGAVDFDELMALARALLSLPTPPKPTTPPAVVIPPFPGRKYFALRQSNTHVTRLGQQLMKKGFGRYYTVGPGPKWSEADRRAVEAFQRAQKWSGSDADGYPGPETWRRLFS
ncbi:peptidoglycan-binding protein [Streptomyces bobili]|uniref:peptidoglycan-binding protein n=1 Tax=Streptomyces bobili TaxID=67280 RepID=UPI0037AF5BC8